MVREARKVIPKDAWFNVIGYKPHAKQKLYHNSKARFRAPICGRRFGKSLMAGRDAEPKLFIPDTRMWIIGPTYDLGEKEFRVIWDDLIIRRELGRDKKVKKSYNKQQGNMYIEFPWQARLEVRTADRPENLVGDSLDHAILSEAAKHKKETWERYIRPALADRRGTADFPTTPEGQNWIFDLFGLGQDPEFEDYESWQFPSWENEEIYPGHINDPEILLLKRTMSKEEFDQEIAADFTSFVGKIYGDFKEATHVKRLTYNSAWPNYMAWDFGYTNPLAAVEFQVTPWDQIRVWREHYKSHLTMDEHLTILRSREQPDGYKIDMCFGDAADPAAVKDINMKFAPCTADPEVKVNWREGIDLVNSFIKMRPSSSVVDEYGTPAEDEPGLLVDFECVNTRREFNNYKGKPGTKVKSPAELPQGIDDHTMDAIRYALMHLYRVGVAGSLSDTMPELDPGKLVAESDTLFSAPVSEDSSHDPLWDYFEGPDDDIFFKAEDMIF